MINDGVLQVKLWDKVKEVRNENIKKQQKCGEETRNEIFGDFFPISQMEINFDKISIFTYANVSFKIKNIPKDNLIMAG